MKKVILTLIMALTMGGSIFAQDSHWPGFDETVYTMNNGIIAYIQIDGNYVTTDMNFASLEVCPFVGDEQRGPGVFLVDYTSFGLSYPVFWGSIHYNHTVSSDVGKAVSLKMFDHESGIEYNICTTIPETIVTGTDYADIFNPVILNFTTPATEPYKLDITGYGEGDGKWYFIASPVTEPITPSAVNGFLTDNYDLYYFDQNGDGQGNEWFNYEANPFTIESKKGYLYASKTDTQLQFAGTDCTDGTVELEYSTTNPDATMHGWNLVGNPFAQPASVDHEFYVMNEAGTEIITGSGNVPAMNGIFVKATAENQSVTFTPNGTNTGSKLALNLVRNDRAASLVDRAIVRFDQGGTLPKFMLDPTNTRVYIPQDGEDYAVATCGDDNVMPVSFKAKENGSYTLKVSIDNVEMGYLHLIDNKTGNDIDLLATPSYTFEANSHDYAERFSLVYATTDGLNESFAFFNGSNWIIENGGKALLQVVDVTGRVLRSEQISGNAEIDLGNVAGVYVLRLINGDNVRVQKVIVK